MARDIPRILILGQFPPSSGGICTNLQNLLSSPIKEKYHFRIFPTGSKKYGKAGYFEESIVQKSFRAAGAFFRFTVTLVTNRPDAAHINTSVSGYSPWRDLFFLALTKLFRVKVLFQVHGGRLDEFLMKRSFFSKLVILRTLRLADQIAVLSSVQKRAFEKYDIQNEIIIVPNIVDANRFSQNSKRKKPGDNLDRLIVILFITPIFFKRKGVWEILEAVPQVTQSHKNVRFVFIGADQEESTMRSYCVQKGLQSYVEFPGRRFGQAIIDAYHNADIFLLPSYQEGFPLTILEAMAAGLPVISTPVGAIPEVIENGVNGFLIPPRDSQALAEKINLLIEHRELREKMAENNKGKVREKYDLRPVSEIFDAIYQELICGKTENRNFWAAA
jgi:glycosyltransferase involved in cell wall biosynthesis